MPEFNTGKGDYKYNMQELCKFKVFRNFFRSMAINIPGGKFRDMGLRHYSWSAREAYKQRKRNGNAAKQKGIDESSIDLCSDSEEDKKLPGQVMKHAEDDEKSVVDLIKSDEENM
jgi:hypothetical protein